MIRAILGEFSILPPTGAGLAAAGEHLALADLRGRHAPQRGPARGLLPLDLRLRHGGKARRLV